MSRIVSGADEIAGFLKQIPPASATHLQNVINKNFREHRKEVIARSDFKTLRRQSLSSLVKNFPKGNKPRKAISEVRGGTDIYWKGLDARTPAEGVAARIEKTVGNLVNRPLRKRFLLIPQGDMLKNGKPRRVADGGSLQQVSVRPLPGMSSRQNRRVGHRNVPLLQSGQIEDAVVVKTRRGLRLIQELTAEKRGKFEAMQYDGEGRRIRATRLGRRTRVLAILKPSAKQARPLDFFGAWARLRSSRDQRFARMLDQIVSGKRASASA